MIILIVVIVLVIIIVALYNMLIARKNAVEQAFGTIDAMLKKRYDLIPNLVETVKQYMNFEQDTLTRVTEMRTKAVSGTLSDNERIETENQIGSMMRGIMVQVENYPELKASNNFMQLQRSWNEVEEQLSASRRTYNAAVTQYNNAIEMFPTNMLAGMMSYQRKAVLAISEEERKNVSAKDLFAQ